MAKMGIERFPVSRRLARNRARGGPSTFGQNGEQLRSAFHFFLFDDLLV